MCNVASGVETVNHPNVTLNRSRISRSQSLEFITAENTLESIYGSCGSLVSNDCVVQTMTEFTNLLQTPRTSGALKKTTSFSDRNNRAEFDDDRADDDDTSDEWFTPTLNVARTKCYYEKKVKF